MALDWPLLVSREHRAAVTSPLVVRFAVWAMVISPLALGIIRYEDLQSWSGGTQYLLLANAAFAGGYLSVRARSRPQGRLMRDDGSRQWDAEALRYSRVVTLCSAAGILASVLFATEMLGTQGIDPGNFVDTRSIFVNATASLLTRIAAVLGAGGFVGLVAVILLWERLPRWRRLVCLAAPCSLTVFSLFSGGRQMMLQLILVSFFASSVRSRFVTRQRLSRKSRIVLLAVLACGAGYGMLVAERRNQFAQVDKVAQLERYFRMQLDPALADRLVDAPPFIRDGVAEGIVYVTHTVPSFTVFWNQQWPGPYLGLWELPFLARRLSGMGLVSKSVDERMAEVYLSFGADGRFAQVWQTSVRDLILDFGGVGALVSLALAGAFASLVFRRLFRRAELPQALLLVWIDMACAYSVLLSAISDTFVFFFFVIAAAMAIPRWLSQVGK